MEAGEDNKGSGRPPVTPCKRPSVAEEEAEGEVRESGVVVVVVMGGVTAVVDVVVVVVGGEVVDVDTGGRAVVVPEDGELEGEEDEGLLSRTLSRGSTIGISLL